LTVDRSSSDRTTTLAAFAAVVLFGGGNGVAVRFSDHELAPLWGATLRFAIAAGILLALVLFARLGLPRGRALVGALLYGFFGFAVAFGLIYWGLVETPAGVGQIILALVPLLTLLLAVAQGLEQFHWRGVIGAASALAGIGLVFGGRVGSAIPILSALAVVVAAVSMAESNVVIKQFPRSHPLVTNAVAMGFATLILLAASLLLGERQALPTRTETWLALGYVSAIGSVGVFSLFVYVLARWPASVASYVMLLIPLVTIAASSALDHEVISIGYLVGGAVVLIGVYFGAFGLSFGRAAQPPPVVATPGCA
jgi:drug/metabolite transporter (DMT)-like permease